jgi:hypothetical protein
MKSHRRVYSLAAALLGFGLCGMGPARLAGADLDTNVSPRLALPSRDTEGAGLPHAGPGPGDLKIHMLEADTLAAHGGKQGAWLGLATAEAPDVLTSQLQLDPGVGLVVTYVATNSPAAKAGLQKNDVLTQFNGQELVHPMQLRRLVQVRKEGDTVRLTYYRAGKQDTVSVVLARSPEPAGWPGMGDWNGAMADFREFQNEFGERYGDALREQMKGLKRSLSDLHINEDQVREEVRRSMDEARRAAEAAVRHATNDLQKLGPSARALEELARGWLGISKDATVTVNSTGNHAKTMVKADDTGTYVIVANPHMHLIAHDSTGKLIFDGEIETPEQQANVPRAIWEKVQPLVEKMGEKAKVED